MEARQPDGPIYKHALPILNKLISYSPEILTEGIVKPLFILCMAK